jgi:hypothetical protein
MDEPDFRAGNLDIRYLEKHEAVLDGGTTDEDVLRAAALAGALLEEETRIRRAVARAQPGDDAARAGSGWRQRGGWRGR